MGKKFYEVVFEGKFDIICGMIEGFMLASGAKWDWYSSTPTMSSSGYNFFILAI